MADDIYNVLSLHTILLMFALGIFGIQIVIIATASNREEPKELLSSVFPNGYNFVSEDQCLEKFVKDLEREIKSFNKSQKLSFIFSAISMCLIPILALYDFCVCNCNCDFYSISFLIPIFEIIINLIIIIIKSKKKSNMNANNLEFLWMMIV